MTEQTRTGAPLRAAEDQWRQLLADAPPISANEAAETEEARAVLAAMRAEGAALSPSETTRQVVWQSIEAALAEQAQQAMPAPHAWWQRRVSWPILVLAGVAASFIGGIALHQQAPPEAAFDWVASRGVTPRLAVADFTAPTPALIGELQALGVAVDWQRAANEIRLSASIPAPLPAGLADWQRRWRVVLVPGQPLSLILVPSGDGS